MKLDQAESMTDRQRPVIIPWRMYVLIAAVAITVTGMVGFGFHKGVRMTAVYAPLIDAAMEIRLEATTGYLWFEELLSSGSPEYIEPVWKHLDLADWYAGAMLEGGQNAEGIFIPIQDAEMRRKIKIVQQKIEAFRQMIRQRLSQKETAGAGSALDLHHHAVYQSFAKHADDVESRLQLIMARDLRSFRSIQVMLIALCLGLFLSVGLSFHRYERRRAKDVLALQQANTRLENQVAERQRTEKLLRSERDKFQGVLNAIGEKMYIVNQAGVIEYQNEGLEKLFPNAVGRKCCATYMQIQGHCDVCPVQDSLRSGQVRQIEADFPDSRSYDMVFSPFTDMDGKIKAIVLQRDITEKKLLQAEAMRAGHLAELGELAAGLAHEINNPVNGIINYAEILLDEYAEEGRDADIPARTLKEAERIARIVKNLLSFARVQSEKPHPLDLQHCFEEVLDLVNRQIIKDNISFHMSLPPDLPRVMGRGQEIQQVFLNLLSNARYALNQKDFGTDETKRLDVGAQVMAAEGRRRIRLTFYDNGTGIAPTIMDKISNPFFSTKPKGEGTGLGLSISHGIVKSHGGQLRFESVPGQYTKVFVDLPVEGVMPMPEDGSRGEKPI